jgi:hypothetical protein
MGDSLVKFIGQVATVTLIVVAIRWIYGAKGADFPKSHDGVSVYGIKWPWRAIGFAGGTFWIVLSIWSSHDRRSPYWAFIIISLVFVSMGLWIASGVVLTDQSGITKKVFWYSQSFRWGDITELRLHTKQGGAIELRAGPRKIVIDSRFIAFRHLLDEIESQTKLKPIAK